MSTDIGNSAIPYNSSQQKIIPSGHSHSFDISIAQQLSVNAAIVYNHIFYWLRINKQKNYNFHDDKTWMYETILEMSEFFGYLSEKQVASALRLLIESNLIITGNYNKNKFDKTTWYALYDESLLGFSKNLFEGDKREVSKPTKGNPLYIQEEHQENVVGEDPLPSVVFEKQSITKSDVYHYSLGANKDWSPEEIESAWIAFTQSKADHTDPYAYIAGIINKKRVLHANKQQEETKCLKTYNKTKKDRYPQQNETSSNNKNGSLSQDTLEQTLAKLKLESKTKLNLPNS